MKLLLLTLLVSSSAAELLCTGPSSSLTIWCNQNCNAAGTPNCPSNICTCQVLSPSAASTPSQTRSRPPSASQTGSRPPSASQTRTRSVTASPSKTNTLTASPSKTTSLTASPSKTTSLTASPTKTSTVSSSQTKSRSASSSVTRSQSPTNTVAPSITQSPFPLGFSIQIFTSSPCTGSPVSVAVGAAHGECLPLTGSLFYKISRASDLIVEIFRSATCELSSRIDTDSTSCQVNCEPHDIETLGRIFWSIQCINPTPSRTPSNTPSVSASQTRSASNTGSSTLTRSATSSSTQSRSASQSTTKSRTASSTTSVSGSITASPSVTPVSGTFAISTSFFSGSSCDSNSAPIATSTAIIGECVSLTSSTFYRATGSSTGLTFRFFSASDCSDASGVDTETASCNSVCERHFVTAPDTQFADTRWSISCTQQSASNSPVPTPSPTSSRAAISGDFEVLVFLGSCDTEPVFGDAATFNTCRTVSSSLFFKANPLDARSIIVEFFTDSTCTAASRVDSEVTTCGATCERHFVSVGPDGEHDEFWSIACAA